VDRRTYGRAFELCGPDIYSLEEIVRLLAWHLRRRRVIIRVPDALGPLQAWVAEHFVPGKPLTVDNFRSLGVASVCSEDGLAFFGIKPRALRAVLPTYLGGQRRETELSRLRQFARR
jgi:uncharacterized protein YbjT (DUF2867 family)